MLNKRQTDRMLEKLDNFAEFIEPKIFVKVGELRDVEFCHVDRQYHTIPDLPFDAAEKGMTWSGEGTYCWFRGKYTVPEEYAGKTLFVKPLMGGYEAMLFVDGKPFGTFATKIVYTGHGNHYCDMIRANAKAGEEIDVAIEWYAGHKYAGCMPNERQTHKVFTYAYEGADICVKDYEVQDFYFDLLSVMQLARSVAPESFRAGELVAALYEVFKALMCSVEDTPWEEVLASIRLAAPILKQALAKKNGDSCGEAAVIGHSHMDTAWLWHVDETIKKCARTYSNQLNLMEQYPEYKFVQSSACHSNMLRVHYPELFARIQKAVAEGKYEPNGGVWVECDCNITSGESMVRQFLWGQRFTRKYFNFTSNCFWLPDTFGYSAAIPQIMKGCGVDYFLTTKISWNDTNKFPYDTFYWQGIDGTKVFTHFNTTHHFPNPEDIIDRTVGSANFEANNGVKQKTVTDKRMLAFGFGDGGGGPQFEMLEFARRCKDTAGCPKTKYSFVGDYMKEIETTCANPNTYRGELYLELHRGTLTNQHTIKRNNRKSELALRDFEIAAVSKAVSEGKAASGEEVAPLYETLLINQFHDILPGTCINRAHVESRAQTAALIKEAREKTALLVNGEEDGSVTVINTLSFERNDALFLDAKDGCIIDGGYAQQSYTDLDGNKKLIVLGVKIPAFGSVNLKWINGVPESEPCFTADENGFENGVIAVGFAENGTISSFVDKRNGRQLVNGKPFNTFILAEDLPAAWDNWDIDADIETKFRDVSELVSREVVSAGGAAFIVRSEYRISAKSTVKQDMIFFADSAEVRFDTAMDWNDDHRFLKTQFDTSVFDDFARHEIQFGCVKRPTTRNTSVEEAKFEVVNHKYTDLSEPKYGVSILNDCKYGITVKENSLRLSLHKGGRHPDWEGDKDGIHRCVYSFLPHNGGFCAEEVIRPAYMLNVPVLQAKGASELVKPALVDAANIIVETVKPCEDAQNAYIVRMYEAEGSFTDAAVTLPGQAKSAELDNMLEEKLEELGGEKTLKLTFKPFEIKTLKVYY